MKFNVKFKCDNYSDQSYLEQLNFESDSLDGAMKHVRNFCRKKFYLILDNLFGTIQWIWNPKGDQYHLSCKLLLDPDDVAELKYTLFEAILIEENDDAKNN